MKLVITVEIPEDYTDVHPDIIVDDLLRDVDRSYWIVENVEVEP